MELHSLFQHGVATERDLRAHANSLSIRVSTWALAGNGAALLLCFNAVLAHQICNWEAVEPFAIFFMLGLVSAFGSVIFAMRSFELAAVRMTKITSAARKAFSHAGVLRAANSTLAAAPEAEKMSYDSMAMAAETGAREGIDEIEKLIEDSKWESVLSWMSSLTLALSIASFGLAVFMAICTDGLMNALCEF